MSTLCFRAGNTAAAQAASTFGAFAQVRDHRCGLSPRDAVFNVRGRQHDTPFVDTKERAIQEAIAELRTVAEVAQLASAMTRREIERLAGAAPAVPEAAGGGAPAATSTGPSRAPTDAYKYVGFEDRFRGTEDEIRARLASYVPYFEYASDVVDIGCGRGEFLDLLKAKGIRARGLDLNHEMVEVCRARGLEAAQGDALSYLGGLADESLGGLLAVQVVEHLEPDYLIRLPQTAFYKLRPGSRISLETIYRAMKFKRVLLCLRDANTGLMTARMGFGPDSSDVIPEFRFPVPGDLDVFQLAVSKGLDIIIADIDDPRISKRIPALYRRHVPAKTFVLLPLKIKNNPVALIYCDNERAGSIVVPENDLTLLKALRNQALLAIKQSM